MTTGAPTNPHIATMMVSCGSVSTQIMAMAAGMNSTSAPMSTLRGPKRSIRTPALMLPEDCSHGQHEHDNGKLSRRGAQNEGGFAPDANEESGFTAGTR